jgi:hypothetical protein
VGGFVDGVLGCESEGVITIVQGWNWYTGANALAVSAGAYDFETIVMHEMGHALGLGHSAVPASVMYATLNTGEARRNLGVADLGIPDVDEGPCALHAGGSPPQTGAQNAKDMIVARSNGDDLLIGGKKGPDLLVPGNAAFNLNDAALRAIMDEWTGASSYANLRSSPGTVANYRLKGDDRANQILFHDNYKKMSTGNHLPDFLFANHTAVKDELIDEITDQATNDLWEDTNS